MYIIFLFIFMVQAQTLKASWSDAEASKIQCSTYMSSKLFQNFLLNQKINLPIEKFLFWNKYFELSDENPSKIFYYQIYSCNPQNNNINHQIITETQKGEGQLIFQNNSYCFNLKESLEEIRSMNIPEVGLKEKVSDALIANDKKNKTSKSDVFKLENDNSKNDYTEKEKLNGLSDSYIHYVQINFEKASWYSRQNENWTLKTGVVDSKSNRLIEDPKSLSSYIFPEIFKSNFLYSERVMTDPKVLVFCNY